MVQYHQKVLALDQIAYWIQDEKVGTVSYDWVRRRQGSDQDGAYTGVTLGEPGIGDGRTSPFFDGVNDFNNIFGATLQGRFNGSEGTVMAWARVANAGVWTDGTTRQTIILQVNGNNTIQMRRPAANNQLRFTYTAGGVLLTNTVASTTTDWFSIAMSWSATADEVVMYFNGASFSTLNGLGVWAGLLNVNSVVIGAANLVPAQPWHGYIAHGAIWDQALTPLAIESLYMESF